jgi:CheY-like chemotaxis protein
LRQNNYAVISALNGQDAINLCRLNKPDLILLDIVMPDMDGYTIANILGQDNMLKDIPIIFMTGKELEHQGIEKRISETFGVYDYLNKPFEFQELLTKIKEVIG